MRNIGILGAMLPVKDIYHAAPGLFDVILSRISADSPLSAAEALQAELFQGTRIDTDAVTSFSTYPTCGTTDENANDSGFLALCTGLERLSDALENVLQWTERLDTPDTMKQEKCAVLLTDKWDTAEFAPYEQQFRYLSMNRNFWFILLLVTEHGCTEIPFLPLELYAFTRR